MAKQSGQKFIKRNRPPRVHITYEDPSNAEEKVELLCTKGGKGSVVLNGVAMSIKQAKQLPSSD